MFAVFAISRNIKTGNSCSFFLFSSDSSDVDKCKERGCFPFFCLVLPFEKHEAGGGHAKIERGFFLFFSLISSLSRRRLLTQMVFFLSVLSASPCSISLAYARRLTAGRCWRTLTEGREVVVTVGVTLTEGRQVVDVTVGVTLLTVVLWAVVVVVTVVEVVWVRGVAVKVVGVVILKG